MSEKLYNVGKVVNTHGIRGELKVISSTDFPDVRFAKGSQLLLVDSATRGTQEVVVESGRQHKNVYILKLSGYQHINEVEKFKGWDIKVTDEHLVELEEDEYYYHEIVGCRVVSEEGREIGTVTEILTTGANDVWVVGREKGKPVLVPVIDDVLLHVDVEQKLITIRLLEGMMDE
ncbi:ribosome maturation factor RimM [Paenibacillus sp. MBLB4367]|uniref:ribosome maturation factor RimM n=1 Tax=Paenibacillus sp. MBLB4367 TaxID=3384767 RepID=UPI0039081920